MSKKYRAEALAKKLVREQRSDDDALETRDWYEEWARTIPPVKQNEPNNNQRSQE